MKKACEALQEKRLISDLSISVRVERTSDWSRNWERKVSGASLVMIHLMKNALKSSFWKDCKNFLDQNHIAYFVDAIDGDMAEHSASIDGDVLETFRKYCLYGGLSNFKNLWLYANGLFDDKAEKAAPPEKYSWAGIYDPGAESRFQNTLSDFEAAHPYGDRPVLGLLFYRDEWIWDDTAYVKAFLEEAEKEGYAVLPVFANGFIDESAGMPSLSEVLETYFMKDGQPVIDALVSTMKFSMLGAGKTSLPVLKKLGVPILSAYTLLTSESDWRKNPEGMNAVETSIAVALPELDGAIAGLPIAGRKKDVDGSVSYVPIPERVTQMVKKAGKWASLHQMKNENKKIAIIFHNYPAKNSNIGSASGLDTMESTIRLMKEMKKAGYQMDFIPETSDDFIRLMTSHATNDISMMTEEQAESCQKLSCREYLDFFRHLGKEAKASMVDTWGEAPGDVMISEKGDILVPGTMDGHLFLTVQPSRQYGMDPSKAYHDPKIPPTHQYLAFYYWLRHVWKADAVIHMGTHGNLEWLPGKSAGMDRGSYPDLALGSLPNIYPYHMTITGEGIQAKRRGGACLVDHLPAPMEEAGTYEELAELEQAMDEYAHFEKSEPETAKRLVPRIRELAKKASLDGEVPYTEADLAGYLSSLHCYIEDLKNSECHVGLHILGEMPKGETLIHEILALLRLPNGDIPSICELLAEEEGTSVDTLVGQAQTLYPNGLTGGEWMARLQRKAEGLVRKLAELHFDKEKAKALGTEREQPLLHFVCEEVYPRLAETKKEITLCRESPALHTRAVSLFCRQG